MPVSEEIKLKSYFLLQGISCMICWTSILNSIDWFNYHFEDYKPDFWFPISFFSLILFIQPPILIFNHLFSHNIQIIPPFIISFIILLLVPLLTLFFPTEFAFFTICILFSITGLFNSICENGLIGLAGLLPEIYLNYIFIGFSLSGVLISILRLIFIKVFPNTIEGYNLSIGTFFTLAAVFQIASIVIQKKIMNLGIVKNSFEKKEQGKSQYYIELKSGEDHEVKNDLIDDYKALLVNLWQYFFLDFFCFFITFLLLSHTSLSSSLSGLSYPEYVAIMILVFNLFDFLGRYSPSLFIIRSLPWLWVLSMLRLLYIFSFSLVIFSKEGDALFWIFGSDSFKLLNMATFAYSSGFINTILVMEASQKTEDKLKDKVGYFMTTAIILGIISGQGFSYLF